MLARLSTILNREETTTAFHSAVQTNHFGVMQVYNLKDTKAKKGMAFIRECLNVWI